MSVLLFYSDTLILWRWICHLLRIWYTLRVKLLVDSTLPLLLPVLGRWGWFWCQYSLNNVSIPIYPIKVGSPSMEVERSYKKQLGSTSFLFSCGAKFCTKIDAIILNFRIYMERLLQSLILVWKLIWPEGDGSRDTNSDRKEVWKEKLFGLFMDEFVSHSLFLFFSWLVGHWFF